MPYRQYINTHWHVSVAKFDCSITNKRYSQAVLLHQLVLPHLGDPTTKRAIFKNKYLVLTILFFFRKHKANTTPEVQVVPLLQAYQEDPKKTKPKPISTVQTFNFYKEQTLKKQPVMFVKSYYNWKTVKDSFTKLGLTILPLAFFIQAFFFSWARNWLWPKSN